jgi:PEP-CTERM motif
MSGVLVAQDVSLDDAEVGREDLGDLGPDAEICAKRIDEDERRRVIAGMRKSSIFLALGAATWHSWRNSPGARAGENNTVEIWLEGGETHNSNQHGEVVMGSSGRAALALVASIVAASAASTSAFAQYNFETLDNPGDPTFNQLLGINNSNQIAGYFGSGAPGHPNEGYLLSPPSSYLPINFFPQTQATGLNNNRIVVGFYSFTNNGPPNDANFGFSFNLNGDILTEDVTDPLTPSVPVPINQLLGVNDAGLAVGFYDDAAGNAHGYLYDTVDGVFSPPINVPGAVSTTPAAINDGSEIAGFYTDATGTHGFIINGGTTMTVNAPGAVSTSLLGLNDNGLADGFYVDASGAMHGLVFNSVTDTFTTVDDPSGIGATTLNGINDKGDLVGFYVDANGNTDGLLATPVPEPSTWTILAAGFAGLGLIALRRRPTVTP